MRHFLGDHMLGHKFSQKILKNTYHTKNQNEIKVSENWGEKKSQKLWKLNQWIKEIKREIRKYLEKKENKSTTFQNKGCSKSGAKGEIYSYKHTKIRKLKSHKL